MEEHDEGTAGFAIDEIDIDEIAVRGIPTFTSEVNLWLGNASCRINSLEMASWQPGRGSVLHLMQQRGDWHIRRRFARYYRCMMGDDAPALWRFHVDIGGENMDVLPM